jgi:hypothetical protein
MRLDALFVAIVDSLILVFFGLLFGFRASSRCLVFYDVMEDLRLVVHLDEARCFVAIVASLILLVFFRFRAGSRCFFL